MVARIYSLDWHDHVLPVPWSGCWLWEGRSRKGYGIHTLSKRDRSVHRLSWEEAHGPIPDGLYVCHRCDVKLCCNPEHLFLGTQQDNLDDYRSKFRFPGAGVTYCIHGHEYTPENTGIQAGGKQRFCRACARARAAVQRRKRNKQLHAAQSREYRREKREAR